MSKAIKRWLEQIHLPQYAQAVILDSLNDLVVRVDRDGPRPSQTLHRIIRVLDEAAGTTIEENGLMSAAVLARNIKRILLRKSRQSLVACLLHEMAESLLAAAAQQHGHAIRRHAEKRLLARPLPLDCLAKDEKQHAEQGSGPVPVPPPTPPLLQILDKTVFPAVADTEPRASRRTRLDRWSAALNSCEASTPEALFAALAQVDPSLAKGRDGPKVLAAIQSWCARNGGKA